MTPIETVQALKAALLELRPATAYGVIGSRDVDQARYRKAVDDALALLAQMQAPVVQVVEPLTEQEAMDAYCEPGKEQDSPPWMDRINAVQRECARKWGLSLKENT